MATLVTKVKPKAATPTVAVQDPIEAPEHLTDEDLADHYGSLKDRVEALLMNPLFGQLKLAEAELNTRLEKHDPDTVITMQGKKWTVEAGACSKAPRKIINVLAVAEAIGTEAFAAIAKVGVSDAEKYMTPDQFATVVWPTPDTPVDETYTKNRKIKTMHIG